MIPLLPPCFSSQKHLAKAMVKTQRNKIVIDCSLLHARAIVHVRNTPLDGFDGNIAEQDSNFSRPLLVYNVIKSDSSCSMFRLCLECG